MKYKLEYIWLDGYEPVPNLRGKTQVKEFKSFPKLEELPMWGFDGSSTRQAEGKSSDCMLKPVAVFPDPAKKNAAMMQMIGRRDVGHDNARRVGKRMDVRGRFERQLGIRRFPDDVAKQLAILPANNNRLVRTADIERKNSRREQSDERENWKSFHKARCITLPL